MKSRLRARSITALAAILVIGVTVDAQAQPPRATRPPPRPDTPRMLVQIFGSADRVAGPTAADELRERLHMSYPSRTLWVVTKDEQIPFLEQSGFSPNQQLSTADEAALAKMLRAEDYVRGSVIKDGSSFRVQAHLVLTRDPALTQPLPVKSGARADRAAVELVDDIREARKQLAAEKRCIDAARNQKYDDAMRIADAAIADYPRATLVRYCKLNVKLTQNAPNAEVIALSEEIIGIDPNAKAALAIAADKYKAEGNVAKANDYLVRLLLLDPTNATLAASVVDALAASGDFTKAKAVVLQAVTDNPGDIALIELQFNVLAAARDYKAAIRTGEEMVQMDTAKATVAYFTRLAALYQADSQPPKVAETYARATQKFPEDAQMWQNYAQALKNAGQVQNSIMAARRALQVNPKIPNGWTQIAVAYNELNFPDSALMALREAKTAGDDAATVGGFALNIGNRLYRAAAADSVKTEAAFQTALPYLHFADSTLTDPAAQGSAKFLIGVSSMYITQSIAQGLQATRSCDEARRAQKHGTDALLYTQQGARTSPDAAGQVLTLLNGTLMPYLDQTIKSICR